MFIVVSLFLGAFCFASFGALLASPATTVPANIMMLSNLVRFPLIRARAMAVREVVKCTHRRARQRQKLWRG